MLETLKPFNYLHNIYKRFTVTVVSDFFTKKVISK